MRGFGRKSRAQTARENNAADRFYARMAGKEPLSQSKVRDYKPRAANAGKTPEAAVNDEISGAFKNDPRVVLWRNNRGVAQYGEALVRYGVGPNGASDWLGYRTVIVTTAMVGRPIAQFVAIEAKAQGESPNEEQARFIERITKAGGRAGCARSGFDAIAIIEGKGNGTEKEGRADPPAPADRQLI